MPSSHWLELELEPAWLRTYYFIMVCFNACEYGESIGKFGVKLPSYGGAVALLALRPLRTY